jgi:hypothetical protein
MEDRSRCAHPSMRRDDDDAIRDFASQITPDEVFGSDRQGSLLSRPVAGTLSTRACLKELSHKPIHLLDFLATGRRHAEVV